MALHLTREHPVFTLLLLQFKEQTQHKLIELVFNLALSFLAVTKCFCGCKMLIKHNMIFEFKQSFLCSVKKILHHKKILHQTSSRRMTY